MIKKLRRSCQKRSGRDARAGVVRTRSSRGVIFGWVGKHLIKSTTRTLKNDSTGMIFFLHKRSTVRAYHHFSVVVITNLLYKKRYFIRLSHV